MSPFAALALVAAGLSASPGVWSLRPETPENKVQMHETQIADASDPIALTENTAVSGNHDDNDHRAGVHGLWSLALFGIVVAVGIASGFLCCGDPRVGATNVGMASKVGCGVAAGLGVYAFLFAVPFVFQSSDEIMIAASSGIAEPNIMVQAALNESARRKYDGIALTLFDIDGNTVSRRSSEESSRIDHAWSQLKFNWIKNRDFNAKRQCHPEHPFGHICAFLTRTMMPFTHRVALPGAVVLHTGGRITGVLAVSGETDEQNAEVADVAVKAAGYTWHHKSGGGIFHRDTHMVGYDHP